MSSEQFECEKLFRSLYTKQNKLERVTISINHYKMKKHHIAKTEKLIKPQKVSFESNQKLKF